ncbi:MAG: serine/threonine protein kinase [Planctomycetes bacterium]|nr:serine/threonine protein kinase [Planctomycetota bacterium]
MPDNAASGGNAGGGSQPPRVYPFKKPEARVTRRAVAPQADRKLPGTDKQTQDGSPAPGAVSPPVRRSAPSIPSLARPAQSPPPPENRSHGIPTVSLDAPPAAAKPVAPPAAAKPVAPPAAAPARPAAAAAPRPVSAPAAQPQAKPVSAPAAKVSPLPRREIGGPVPADKIDHNAAAKAQAARASAPSMGGIGEITETTGEVTEVGKTGAVRDDTVRMEYRTQPSPALTETQDMDPAEVEPPPPVGDSTARVSFGQAAVMLKLVTPPQIQECVNVQRALLQKGQRVPLLGQILLQRGYLDKAGVERIKSYQQMYQISDKIPGYKLMEKLGQGAMGTVYKAKQVRMERWVAIKVLQPELAANPTIKGRFLQEARASARLNHPNVITGIDAGEVNGLCYFAMEYVEGKTLQQLVKERGAMDERQALEAIVQVGKALEHAEKHSLVHRDVKPDNIMVTRDRTVKLLDLGLAKVRAAEDTGSAKGMAVGTPNYISPEQAMGRQDIDTRSDIYSLGVTLYFALTARVPFEGPPEVVMYRHIHEPPPHPRNFRPDVGDATSTLIFNMMAKRPEDRPASANQLVSDIEHLIRTGRLPGLFDGPPPPGGLKVNKDSRQIVKSGRLPNLKGYGMPGAPAAQVNPPAPPAPTADDPRLPRKRKKRFDGSW